MLWEVWNQVPAYRAKMEAAGIHPLDLRCLEDLRKMPFTTKKDLRDNYPTGLLARPVRELARFHASSGTTGKPTVVAYTKNDLDNWAILIERCLRLAGVTSEDVVQVAYGYGLFTGGMGLHYGAERLGATVIPASGGFTERQILLMEDLEATVLCCTPSYALHLAEALRKAGKSLPKLRIGFFGAEPWSEEMRRRIESELGIRAFDLYGLSEVMGPGVAVECPLQNGLHLWDDHFIAEIVDPESGEVLPSGAEGELVITTLTKEGLPMIRYRTRDLSARDDSPCPCGCPAPRIRRIGARSDDMLIIRGVNVFPSQVETALGRIPGISLNYLLELSERNGMKDLTVRCEAEPGIGGEDRARLERETGRRLVDSLGVRVGVRVEPAGTLPRSQGKAVRVERIPSGAETPEKRPEGQELPRLYW
jgi:phenylacetate-CoA ligase